MEFATWLRPLQSVVPANPNWSAPVLYRSAVGNVSIHQDSVTAGTRKVNGPRKHKPLCSMHL